MLVICLYNPRHLAFPGRHSVAVCGTLYLALDAPQHGIYRVDLQSGAVSLVAKMGHAGGEGEGIDATDLPSGLLHAMCVDKKFVPVWFEHFRIPIS